MRSASVALSAWLDATTTAGPFPHLVTITPRVGSVARWTDYPDDVTYSGNTYTAGGAGTVPLIEVGRREEVAGTEIGSLEITLLCGETAAFNSVRLPLAAASGAFDGATVLVYRHYWPAGGDDYAMHLFKGRVAEAEPSSSRVVLQIESGLVALNVPVPRLRLQPGCGNVLFDTQCGLVKATYTETATVSSGATTTSVPTDRTKANDYFTLGVMTFTSGALNGVSRAVRAYANSGGTFTPDRPLSVAPSNGDTFTVYPGCPRTLSACQTKWPGVDNSARYRGFPFPPTHDWAPISVTREVEYPIRPIDPSTVREFRRARLAPRESVLPVVYGQNRTAAKLVYVSAPRSQGSRVIVDAILALSEGPITGVGLTWQGKQIIPTVPSAYIFTGTRPTQTAWTVPPSAERLGYPGVAYVAAGSTMLNASELDTFAYEVKGLLNATGNAAGDADPADVILDVLTDEDFGAGQSASDVVTNVGQDGTAASSYERYVTAEGLWISPVLDEQRPAIEWVREFLDATNSELLWSEGKFKILPLGDSTKTGGGVTYTPYLTLQYALGVDDLLAEDDEDAVSIERPRDEDMFNTCPVEFSNRAPTAATDDPSQAYLPETVDDPEPVDLGLRGARRATPISLRCICLQDVALKMSRIRAQRSVLARNTYRFRLGWRFARLEPLDLVSLTDPLLGLSATPVRIMEISEDAGAGTLEFVAEDWPTGVGSAVAHTAQSSDGPVTALGPYNPELRAAELALSNWTKVDTSDWKGIAFNGTRLVAVGASTCSTSEDGAVWTSRTIPAGTYYAATWNGTVFVAIGAVCASSTDGITWTARTITGGPYYDLAWDGSNFVAVGSSSCATSPDGITWTARTIAAGVWYGVTWDDTQFVAVGTGNLCATSPTGTTWTTRTIPTGNYWVVRSGAGRSVALGASGVCATSEDGITWTARSLPAAASSRGFAVLAHSPYVFCAVANVLASSPQIVIASVDGITWMERAIAFAAGDSAGGTKMLWAQEMGIFVTAGAPGISRSSAI